MSLSIQQWKKILPKEYYGQLDNCITHTIANMEPTISRKRMGEKKDPRFTAPVCITIHSVRGRLADADGISGKATIDGLVKGSILQDDRQDYVREVRFSQEQGWPEKTIIKIQALEGVSNG